MPSHSRAAEVTLPEAADLADLYSIRYDLEDAAHFCQLAIAKSGSHWPESAVEEALSIAAVIKYARCFNSGVRVNLSLDEIMDLPIGNHMLHPQLLALRDKFVAHSVNTFEETYVTATVTEKDGVRLPVTSIHPGTHRIRLSGHDAAQLIEQIVAVLVCLNERIAAEEKTLLAHINTLPLETIHRWDLHSPKDLGTQPAGVPRKRNSGKRRRRATRN